MTTVLRVVRRGHAGLVWCAVGMAVLAVVLVAVSALDRRTLLGAPLWDKPLQFALSQAVYTGAMAWMLSRLPAGTFRRTGWVVVVCCTIEIVLISVQAGRGVRSHFNTDTAGDFAVFGLMGFFVAGIWLATVAVALRFLRTRVADRATDAAVRFGLVIALAGMAVGVVMSVHLGHSVGVPDGGPGLSFVNWSTTGGDLRVSHFAGLHALQILPLVAAGLRLLPPSWLDDDQRHRLMLIAGYGYGGLFVLVFWQALRGQPLLAPDRVTLGSLAAVVLVAGGAAAAVLARRRTCDGTATNC